MNSPKWLIVHHTATAREKTTFAAVNRYHRDKWWFKSSLGFYAGYQYFIAGDGVVTQARSDTDVGAHTIGKNESSLGVCLAGNFDVELPSQEQVTALTGLLKEKAAQYSIPPEKIVPHRTFSNTHCYGNSIADDWARNLVKGEAAHVTQPLQPASASTVAPSSKDELISLLEKALQRARDLQ